MPKDPLGFIARVNALSLMLITPEFYKVRRMRIGKASRINYDMAKFTMKPERTRIDGMDIRMAANRQSEAPTVLFLSPLPQSILCYDAVWAQLQEKVDLIAVDLPGFGRSEGSNDHMSFAAQSAFLEKFVEKMDLSDVHIVAPDVAMPVAMHYVMNRDHKAKSLLVGDGPGILPSSDGSLIRKIVGSGFWRTLVRLNGAKTFIAGAFQRGYLHYSPKQAEIEDFVASYSGRIGQITNYFKQYPEGCKDLTDNIASLDVPVQVFWADQDAFLGVENARLLHSKLPDSKMHIFENCGHFCYQDKNGEFADMIEDWIVR